MEKDNPDVNFTTDEQPAFDDFKVDLFNLEKPNRLPQSVFKENKKMRKLQD